MSNITLLELHNAVKEKSAERERIQEVAFNPLAIEPHLITPGVTTAISGYYGYPITIIKATDTWEGIGSFNQLLERIHELGYEVSHGNRIGKVDDIIRYHRIHAHPYLSKHAGKIWDASKLMNEAGEKAKSRYDSNNIRVPVNLHPQEKQALEGLSEGLKQLKERASEKRDRITDSTRAIKQMGEIIDDALQNKHNKSVIEIQRAISYLTMLSFTTVLSRKECEMIESIKLRVENS